MKPKHLTLISGLLFAAAPSSADVIGVNSGELLVRLPAAKILHVVVDKKSTKVWDRR